MFKSPEIFAARLTEVEKAIIRNAQTMDRLEYLFLAVHRHEVDIEDDTQGFKMFLKMVDIVRDQFTKNSAQNTFGKTWAF